MYVYCGQINCNYMFIVQNKDIILQSPRVRERNLTVNQRPKKIELLSEAKEIFFEESKKIEPSIKKTSLQPKHQIRFNHFTERAIQSAPISFNDSDSVGSMICDFFCSIDNCIYNCAFGQIQIEQIS